MVMYHLTKYGSLTLQQLLWV